ncbi:MAG: Gamma-glutamyltranspeptidase @ Glutathione hydrolase [uncultured Thermomicrobiales bacterium]|uniref:Glutathione hydrolase proenzyme n=1 Tax=uncultured Thermomicrobiales bacterium TaxID=1645740 RepID=A0A6J4VL87_9BACT|nr:MAG: Gamma-glutamyltranspeptidase @ Glutathione hydrolase [uncultured Thermomicrobiales bacterium]
MAGPHGLAYAAHRPVVMGARGMVVAGNPLAARAGSAILAAGGNAIDAAIAIAVALGVVEPNMSGIGGDGFIMIARRDAGTVEVVNATGAAPAAATRAAYADGIPTHGARSVSVPGILDGWLAAHERHGTLTLADLFAEAITLADGGFPVSHKLAAYAAEAPALGLFPTARAIFWRDGRPLRAGEILRQGDLARTLVTIAREGRGALYGGALGRALATSIAEAGGLLTLDDLAAHRTRWQEPIATTYRGHTVYEAPPNSSGHILLQELNLVEQFDFAGRDPLDPDAIHLMVEAKKLAFADREGYVADPEWTAIPLAGLLSKEYAAARRAALDPDRAATGVQAGDAWRYDPAGVAPVGAVATPIERREDTTCFAVVDRWGNAVCQLQSIQSSFGSCLVAGETGILLNNRMTYWHLDENHPDRLEPGKRVRHTMNPVLVFAGDEPILALGTPGADTQVQTNLQLISAILDHGMTVQEAAEAPRWRHRQIGGESTVPHGVDDVLVLEDRFPEATRAALAARGHALEIIGPWEAGGSAVVIRRDPATGALDGGADPRRDAYAIGL